MNEMQELQQQGINVSIVAKYASDEELVHEKAQALDIPIYYLPSVSSIPRTSWEVRHLENLSSNPSLLRRDTLRGRLSKKDYKALIEAAMIAPFIENLGVDIIHAHFATWATTAASFVSSITGIPYSFTAHAKDIYHQSVDKTVLSKKIAKARFVITVSDFNKRYLEDLLRSEGRSGQIIRLYNGIDLEQFRPHDDIEKEPNLLLGVGRLTPKKGFKYLIEACKILHEKGMDFRCVIIGKGDERATLEKLVEQYSLEQKVYLLGAKTQAEVMRIIQKATALVLPCIVSNDGDRDALPTVLIEAMALGVPVVSTNVTGIPEIIAHERTGLLVEEKNSKALADALETLLDSESLCKKLSRAALVKVREEFNVVENVKTLKGCFLSGGSCNQPPSNREVQ
ncbi:MAG: glycosyltransferase [Candidatus Brocadiales bacterium]